MQRLGKNIGGYYGERIEITAVLNDCILAGKHHAWSVEKLPCDGNIELLTFTRPSSLAPRPSSHVYISAGIHGDEPAGPLAVCQLLQENQWPKDISLSIFPCLNPAGFALHTRENAEGLDLNRQYLQPLAAETRAHVAWLQHQPRFDLCLALHEDWESHGFYVYELNADNQPTLAEKIVERVAEVCPIDPSELIEGRPAQNGIIRPSLDPRSRPQWPESFFLLTHKTRLTYTLEAPSDYPLSTRVAGLVTGVRAALDAIKANS